LLGLLIDFIGIMRLERKHTMHRVLRLRPSPGLAAATLALLLAFGGAAWAAAGSSGGTVIHACAAKHGVRTLTLAEHGHKCPQGDASISWNQQGQPGPAGEGGLNGPQGLTGAEGKEGKAGAAGKNGTNGVTGYQVVTKAAEVSVAASETKTVTATAACPTGKVLFGGGTDSSAGFVTNSGPVLSGSTPPKNEWQSAVSYHNETANPVTVTVTAVAYCGAE
jgi:hypothetical protein